MEFSSKRIKRQTSYVRTINSIEKDLILKSASISHDSNSLFTINAEPSNFSERERFKMNVWSKKKRGRSSLVDDLGPQIFADFVRDAPAGSLLPHEGALCSKYSVSRATIRTVMRNLQEAGYLIIRQGVGTIVLPRSLALDVGMDALLSFETIARLHNIEITTSKTLILQRLIPEGIASVLELPLDTEGSWVQRAKLIDGNSVAWMVDFIPSHVMSMKVIKEKFEGSVLDVLMNHGTHEVGYADCDVLPVALPLEIAEFLDVTHGSMALSMEEITRSTNGTALAWGRSWMLPSKLSFALRRRRRFI